jgi:hypothetical protein
MNNEQDKMFEIYCPCCEKVTDKVSITLLKEIGKIQTNCPICCSITILEYSDGQVTIDRP